MTEDATNKRKQEQHAHEEFTRQVSVKQRRKLRALRHSNQNVWFGLGMFGLVGWSVAVPALLFTTLGIWLDSAFPSPRSWTLMLLIVGTGLGCLNAWHWVSKERKEIERERHNNENRKEENDAS